MRFLLLSGIITALTAKAGFGKDPITITFFCQPLFFRFFFGFRPSRIAACFSCAICPEDGSLYPGMVSGGSKKILQKRLLPP
ncbi:hypothetical protein ACGVWS_15535 [Enterobacteriaceae bacterium LUAb1]